MVTYQFQLINLNNGNSDVFKQLESYRSSPGQPCCVFVPKVSNKATSPINIHTYTYIHVHIYTYQWLSTAMPCYADKHACVLPMIFIIVNVIVFLQSMTFLSSASLNKRKEISIGWPSFQFLCCHVNSIVQTIPMVLKRGNHWFDLVTRFRKELPPTALGSVKGLWPV